VTLLLIHRSHKEDTQELQCALQSLKEDTKGFCSIGDNRLKQKTDEHKSSMNIQLPIPVTVNAPPMRMIQLPIVTVNAPPMRLE